MQDTPSVAASQFEKTQLETNLCSGHHRKLKSNFLSWPILGRLPAILGPKTFKRVRLEKWCGTHLRPTQETNYNAIS